MSILSFPSTTRAASRSGVSFHRVQKLAVYLIKEWHRARASRAMASLSDDMLRDMGVARSEIDEVVRHGRPRRRR